MDRYAVIDELDALRMNVNETYEQVSSHRTSLPTPEEEEQPGEEGEEEQEPAHAAADEEEVDESLVTDADRLAMRNMFAFIDEVRGRLQGEFSVQSAPLAARAPRPTAAQPAAQPATATATADRLQRARDDLARARAARDTRRVQELQNLVAQLRQEQRTARQGGV